MKKTKYLIVLLIFINLSNTFAGFIPGNFKFDNKRRKYTIYVPSIYYTQNKPVPMLIGLHGFGDNIENFRNICLTGIADTANYICVYAEALPDPVLGVFTWNSGASVAGVPFNNQVDDVGFLNALMDTVISKYMIDQKRIYMFGYSFGAFMTNRMACESSDRLAAVAAVSGDIGLSLNCQPANIMPFIYFHGTADDVIKYYNNYYGKDAEVNRDYWVEKNHCNPDPVYIDTLPDNANDGKRIVHFHYEGTEHEEVVEFYKVINGDHEWLGLPDNDISYCQTIWAFFRQFENNRVTTGIQNHFVKGDFNIYPNPTNGQFTLDLSSLGETVTNVNIYNAGGILSLTKNVKGQYRVSLEEKLPSGLYFVQLTGENGVLAGKKLVIR